MSTTGIATRLPALQVDWNVCWSVKSDAFCSYFLLDSQLQPTSSPWSKPYNSSSHDTDSSSWTTGSDTLWNTGPEQRSSRTCKNFDKADNPLRLESTLLSRPSYATKRTSSKGVVFAPRCHPVVKYLNLNAALIQGFYLERYQTRALRPVNKAVFNMTQNIKAGEPDCVAFKFLLRKEDFPRDFYDLMHVLPYPTRQTFPVRDHRAAWPTVLAFQWKNKNMVAGHRELTNPQQPGVEIPYKHITTQDLQLEKQYHTLRDILGLRVAIHRR